jgi:hypothetical protein
LLNPTVPAAFELLARNGTAPEDPAQARLLPELLEEYRARLRPGLGPVGVSVDGREYPTLLDAFADPSASFSTFTLDLAPSAPDGPLWEYLHPIERIEVDADQGAEVRPRPSAKQGPRRGMIRGLLREHYPAGGASRLPAPGGDGVPTFPVLAKQFREHGVVPFQIALLVYLSEERIRFEIDLVGNQLLPDRRAGRLPVSRRIHRSSRVSHGVDAQVAKGGMALTNARALEVLADTHGLNDVEMAHVLGGVRELGRSALDALKSRHYASFDARLGLYRPRLDAFLPTGDRAKPSEASPKLPPIPDPALRTSVSELLAAADARATCPLCGDVLPPGPRGILCANCQQEIGRAT